MANINYKLDFINKIKSSERRIVNPNRDINNRYTDDEISKICDYHLGLPTQNQTVKESEVHHKQYDKVFIEPKIEDQIFNIYSDIHDENVFKKTDLDIDQKIEIKGDKVVVNYKEYDICMTSDDNSPKNGEYTLIEVSEEDDTVRLESNEYDEYITILNPSTKIDKNLNFNIYTDFSEVIKKLDNLKKNFRIIKKSNTSVIENLYDKKKKWYKGNKVYYNLDDTKFCNLEKKWAKADLNDSLLNTSRFIKVHVSTKDNYIDNSGVFILEKKDYLSKILKQSDEEHIKVKNFFEKKKQLVPKLLKSTNEFSIYGTSKHEFKEFENITGYNEINISYGSLKIKSFNWLVDNFILNQKDNEDISTFYSHCTQKNKKNWSDIIKILGLKKSLNDTSLNNYIKEYKSSDTHEWCDITQINNEEPIKIKYLKFKNQELSDITFEYLDKHFLNDQILTDKVLTDFNYNVKIKQTDDNKTLALKKQIYDIRNKLLQIKYFLVRYYLFSLFEGFINSTDDCNPAHDDQEKTYDKYKRILKRIFNKFRDNYFYFFTKDYIKNNKPTVEKTVNLIILRLFEEKVILDGLVDSIENDEEGKEEKEKIYICLYKFLNRYRQDNILSDYLADEDLKNELRPNNILLGKSNIDISNILFNGETPLSKCFIHKNKESINKLKDKLNNSEPVIFLPFSKDSSTINCVYNGTGDKTEFKWDNELSFYERTLDLCGNNLNKIVNEYDYESKGLKIMDKLDHSNLLKTSKKTYTGYSDNKYGNDIISEYLEIQPEILHEDINYGTINYDLKPNNSDFNTLLEDAYGMKSHLFANIQDDLSGTNIDKLANTEFFLHSLPEIYKDSSKDNLEEILRILTNQYTILSKQIKYVKYLYDNLKLGKTQLQQIHPEPITISECSDNPEGSDEAYKKIMHTYTKHSLVDFFKFCSKIFNPCDDTKPKLDLKLDLKVEIISLIYGRNVSEKIIKCINDDSDGLVDIEKNKYVRSILGRLIESKKVHKGGAPIDNESGKKILYDNISNILKKVLKSLSHTIGDKLIERQQLSNEFFELLVEVYDINYTGINKEILYLIFIEYYVIMKTKHSLINKNNEYEAEVFFIQEYLKNVEKNVEKDDYKDDISKKILNNEYNDLIYLRYVIMNNMNNIESLSNDATYFKDQLTKIGINGETRAAIYNDPKIQENLNNFYFDEEAVRAEQAAKKAKEAQDAADKKARDEAAAAKAMRESRDNRKRLDAEELSKTNTQQLSLQESWLQKKQRLADKERHLLAIIQQYPNDVDALKRLGKLLNEKGEYTDAIKYYDAAHALYIAAEARDEAAAAEKAKEAQDAADKKARDDAAAAEKAKEAQDLSYEDIDDILRRSAQAEEAKRKAVRAEQERLAAEEAARAEQERLDAEEAALAEIELNFDFLSGFGGGTKKKKKKVSRKLKSKN